MGERDAERRRLRDDAVGDGQRREPALDGERVHGHLAPGDELLDQHDARPRFAEREREGRVELLLGAHEHEPLLALAVGRLDHARVAERGRRGGGLLERGADDVARVGDARLGEALALAELRGGQHGGGRVDRVRQRLALGDPRGDRDRPVDARRDQAVDPLRGGEAVDLGLVLDRDDRAAVGEAEAGRGRVAVDGHDEQAAVTGGLEESELAGARP